MTCLNLRCQSSNWCEDEREKIGSHKGDSSCLWECHCCDGSWRGLEGQQSFVGVWIESHLFCGYPVLKSVSMTCLKETADVYWYMKETGHLAFQVDDLAMELSDANVEMWYTRIKINTVCTPTTNTGTWRLGGSSNPRFHHIYGIYWYDVPCCVHVLGDVVHLTSYASTIKQFLPTGATLHGRQTAEFQSPSGRVSCRHTGHQELVWNGMNQWTMSCYVVMLFPAFFFWGGVSQSTSLVLPYLSVYIL